MKKIIMTILTISIITLCILIIPQKINTNQKNLCLYVVSSSNKHLCDWRENVINNIAKYYKIIIISNGELEDKCNKASEIIIRKKVKILKTQMEKQTFIQKQKY